MFYPLLNLLPPGAANQFQATTEWVSWEIICTLPWTDLLSTNSKTPTEQVFSNWTPPHPLSHHHVISGVTELNGQQYWTFTWCLLTTRPPNSSTLSSENVPVKAKTLPASNLVKAFSQWACSPLKSRLIQIYPYSHPLLPILILFQAVWWLRGFLQFSNSY